ncbi:hypothetical protein VSH64_14000 [Amycolatopsis rhabdoformis]|uniref:Transmembrane protein n=1 Tax=Amycolatopsis rhabdoformis TaxID=1448059 RepID=A0ABZ1IH01_9PSEU|nr:hypothetical protein [Amycolatopsis rhabdoformis]WSE33212.1 hypothetical protein VSH64_14000 [Amycolatopsis rhabdoformis]
MNVDDLDALGQGANQTILTIMQESWSVRIVFTGSTVTVYEDGDLRDSADADRLGAISAAIEQEDAVEIVEECIDMSAHLSVELVNDPQKSRFHYVDSVDYLHSRLTSPGWHKFIGRLFEHVDTLIVGDLEDSTIALPELKIHGKAGGRGNQRILTEISVGRDGDVSLPSPQWLAPLLITTDESSSAKGIEGLADLFRGCCSCLTFAALADRVDSSPTALGVVFSGVRVVNIPNIAIAPASDVTGELALLDWAFPGYDSGKREAVQQAASLTLADGSGFQGGASPIYRTARSVHDLSQRGAVAEALANRRTARGSAINVALDAAKLCREIVTKALERTVIQLGAAVGIVIANAKDLFGSTVSGFLLAALTLLIVLSWLISYRLELVSANDAIESTSTDLQEYRDSLSEDDIEAIRNLQTIKQAKNRIVNSKRIVTSLSVAFASIFAIGSIYFLTGHKFALTPSVNQKTGPQVTATLPSPPSSTPKVVHSPSLPARPSGHP